MLQLILYFFLWLYIYIYFGLLNPNKPPVLEGTPDMYNTLFSQLGYFIYFLNFSTRMSTPFLLLECKTINLVEIKRGNLDLGGLHIFFLKYLLLFHAFWHESLRPLIRWMISNYLESDEISKRKKYFSIIFNDAMYMQY